MKQAQIDFSGAFHFDPRSSAVAPSPHVEARETSALAAIENAQTSRKAIQNTRILLLIKAAGEQRDQRHRTQSGHGYSALMRNSYCS